MSSAREARAVVGELAQYGVDALAVRCDVIDEISVREMVKDVAAELGGIDVLVNNAANYETVEFEKITVALWDAIFASNTRGPFLVSREALPYLRKRKGRIVNMGSLGGLRPWATHAHYCSSKAAVHMLTKVMAEALAPEIAVNAVAPGMIDLGEKSAASFMKKMAKQTPMQRNGSAADIAAAVMFFAHYYIGLNEDLLCHKKAAREHLADRRVEVLDASPPDRLRAQAEAAVKYCPTHALSIVEEGD